MTALIVLPGLDGTASLHSAFADAIAKSVDSFTVIAYPIDEPLDYPPLESLVRASLPIDRPFVLLGESFSGPIALSIAANPPANLVGVVLSTTFASPPMPLLAPLATLARFAPVRSIPSAPLSWLLLGRWATPQLERSLSEALLTVSPSVLRSRAAIALRADVTSCLPAILVPVLYLRATGDRLLGARAGNDIAAAIPQCSIADIPGPHLLLQAVPQPCALAIGDFIARRC